MEKIITENYAIEFESGYDSLIEIIDKMVIKCHSQRSDF